VSDEPKAEAVPFTVFRVERDGHVTHTLARLGKPSLCIPAAKAREFLSEGIRLAAILAVEIPAYEKSCDEFLVKAKTLKATLPE